VVNPASPARIAAARALIAVEEGAHLEDALAELAPPPGPDRTQAWFLAFGVVRRRGTVDAALRPHLGRPLADLDPEVRAVLRLGAFERMFARTADHAVVHQAVEVSRALGLGRASGLINAVVRRVGASPPEADDHPLWLLQRWRERYGPERADAWAKENAEQPPLFVVARQPGLTLPVGATPVVSDGVEVSGLYRVDPSPRAPITELDGFLEGHWWVQDLASARMTDLVGAAPGDRVLDACAAPGGKAFRLAALGAEVLAVDRSSQRLAMLRTAAKRLELPILTQSHDWTRGPLKTNPPPFDAVLVDAPCSSLGTLRRHPEVRWKRQPHDLIGAGNRQLAILQGTAAHTKVGGALVYAVCSPEPEETTDVVERFVDALDGAFAVEQTLSTAPPEQGEDAHFAARLRRLA